MIKAGQLYELTPDGRVMLPYNDVLETMKELERLKEDIEKFAQLIRQETIAQFTELLYNNGIDHSNDPNFYKALAQMEKTK